MVRLKCDDHPMDGLGGGPIVGSIKWELSLSHIVVKIGKRNGLTPKKRTKINVHFSNGGTFCLQKKRVFCIVMQMQRIVKIIFSERLHDFFRHPFVGRFRSFFLFEYIEFFRTRNARKTRRICL